MDLALNNLQWLICKEKQKQTNKETNVDENYQGMFVPK